MATLDDAIALLQQGRKPEAQQQFYAVIRENPKNISAWLWFAESFYSTATKIQALEACLQFNPEDPQTLNLLETLKAQLPSTPTIPDSHQTPEPVNSTFIGVADDEPPIPSNLNSEAVEQQVATERADLSLKATWLENGPSNQGSIPRSADFGFAHDDAGKANVHTGAHYPFYMVWWIAVTNLNWRAYAHLLEDPKANVWRAFRWMLWIESGFGLLGGIFYYILVKPKLSGSIFADFIEAFFTLTPGLLTLWQNSDHNFIFLLFVLGFALIGVLASLIWFALGIGLKHLLSILLGGQGTYDRLFYAVATYNAPLTLAFFIALLSEVRLPFVILLTIYGLILNVFAVTAVYRLNILRSIVVTLLPVIFGIVIFCFAILQIYIYIDSNY